MKKFVSILLGFFLLMVSLTGCSGNSTTTSTPSSDSTMPSSQGTSQEAVKSEFPDLNAIPNSNWSSVQPEAEAQILAEMAGGYTPENPLVIVDPYKVSPLTALVIFDAPEECSVTVTIPGKAADTTFTHEFSEVGMHHEIPVYALYAGVENKVEIDLESKDGTIKKYIVPISTEPLPDYLPPYEIIVNDREKAAGELLYMAMATDAIYPIAIDKAGEVRWYSSHKQFSGGIFRRMESGRFLSFAEALYAPAFIRPGIVTTDRMGKVYSQYLQDAVHHDTVELPNGNLLMSAIKEGTELSMGGMIMGQDVLHEVSIKDGSVQHTWDLNEICGYAHTSTGETFRTDDPFSGEYLHINSVWYNQADDSIMVSSPTMKVVVKFKADTNEIVWAIGDPRHSYPDPLQSKILKPIGDNFEWNGAQHAAMVLPNGDIMMDDNGSGRFDAAGVLVPDAENYSRLVIFRVNEKDMTIEQIYQYGKERGNELFATYLGDADYLGENHYLMNAGGRIIDEKGVAQGSAFDVYMGIKQAEAKIVEIRDGKVVFEMKVGGVGKKGFNNIYRVEKDTVYGKNESEYDLANMKALQVGKLLPSATVEFTLPATYDDLVLTYQPTNYGYQLNVQVVIDNVSPKDVILMELKGIETVQYYPVSGMGGAQGIVRASGLTPGEYAIGFVLKREDGGVAYKKTDSKWVVEV